MKKVEAVWLATAVLTFENFQRKGYLKFKDIYFRQIDIINKAFELLGNTVPSALASSHCVANTNGSIYNYLVAGGDDKNNEKYRRISYFNEFNGIKERPNLDGNLTITTSSGDKAVSEIYKFVKEDFTDFLLDESSSVNEDFNYRVVFNFLEQYAGKEYKAIERAQDDRKEEFREIRRAGKEATAELEKITNLCREKFEFKKFGKCSWLDASGQLTKKYLWRQMKRPGNAECKSSLSIFAENDAEDQPILRLSIELNEDQSSVQDYAKHHQLLSRALDDALVYVVKSPSGEIWTKESHEVVKDKIKNGTYEKVQVSYSLTKKEIEENKYSSPEIMNIFYRAIKKLIPYYLLIIGTETQVEKDKGEQEMNTLNTILYGPPGTGKTYNTVNYAVSIIENTTLKEVCDEDYKNVFERYLTYKEQGHIGFVTFHQSYGYEEFIEGIKPVLDDSKEDGIQYNIESGIFKEFCESAQQLTLTANDEEIEGDKNVWKISLGGSGSNWLKTECFNQNQIRIGWDSEGIEFLEDGNYPSDTLYYFYEEMSIGDFVFSLADQKHIDAIGIITGEPEWLETEENYKRSIKVNWLVTDIYENIYELNGKKNLVQQTIYRLSRLSTSDVNNLILKYSKEKQVDVKENNDNYVFIIDEINRGNISKIFGELITLLEPNKRIGAEESMHLKLPYSQKEFGVPRNVYILGTMNTADRSIALMDTALR
ncbi:AAA family ATPase [Bacillus mesophilum]|uniref:AAA family ATPase n=1 Tax=Bacillus mesophilum TaxID=1071718 RepID=UPI001F01CA6C|nr:AAA family ATPase [Bacillus mesophilum]